MMRGRCRVMALGPATAAALALATGCSLSTTAPIPAAVGVVSGVVQPNVLVLFADDLRRDGVAALGSANLRTPHLDRLVNEGLSFDKAYVAGSIHGAVCMPSRAMLMTGRHFNELPLTITSTWSVPAEERGLCEYPTLFEVFDSAGYETFMTGKWHNGAPMLRRGLDGGGSIFLGGMSDHDKVPVHDFDPTGKYGSEGKSFGKSFSSELFADEAIDEIASVAAEVNATVENIGARRLHTVMERLLDEVSYTATDQPGETITIDATYVRKHVSDLAKDSDLSKFIL